MTNHVHRCIVTIVITATADSTTDVMLLVVVVNEDRRRNRFSRSPKLVSIELGVQGCVVELGFVGFLHQELGRVHTVIHHRRSSIDDIRSAVAQFFVFDIGT